MPRPSLPDDLKARLVAPVAPVRAGGSGRRVSGADVLDTALSSPGLHEVYALSTVQAAAVDGFGLGFAMHGRRSSLIWIYEQRGRHETGALSGAGLHEWGLEVRDLLLIRVPDARGLLAAGEEALRSSANGVVLMSGWGESPLFTLTASRRLALACAEGGGLGVLMRNGARPQPSAARTRWSIEAAPSAAMEARAPGRPAFRVSLLRSRAGLATGDWIMEWDRERRAFVEPETSGRLVSVSADGPARVRAA